jgi:hypothetical protein
VPSYEPPHEVLSFSMICPSEITGGAMRRTHWNALNATRQQTPRSSVNLAKYSLQIG